MSLATPIPLEQLCRLGLVSSVVAERRYSVAMRRGFAAYGFHQRRNSCLTSAMTLPANTVYLLSKGSFL